MDILAADPKSPVAIIAVIMGVVGIVAVMVEAVDIVAATEVVVVTAVAMVVVAGSNLPVGEEEMIPVNIVQTRKLICIIFNPIVYTKPFYCRRKRQINSSSNDRESSSNQDDHYNKRSRNR